MKVGLTKASLHSIAVVFMLSLSGGVFAQEKVLQENMTTGQKRQLESDLTGLVQDVLNENNFKYGPSRKTKFKLTYDQLKDTIYIDFDKSAIPKEHTPSFDEDLQLIFQTVSDAVGQSVPVSEIKFLFGGFDIYHYFPEDRIPVENPGKGMAARSQKSAANPVMLISAGHGLVLVNATNPAKAAWAYQRPTITNQIEDLQTSVLASAVATSVSARSSNVTQYLARSTSNDAYNEACSGTPVVCPPFKNMAGRYYIKSLLPDNPEIWNSYSAENKRNSKDHEYDDIRSRGLYANHVQADQMITIHTNAASKEGTPQTTASGSRLFYNSSKAGASTLASNLTCAMKEIINSNSTYANWAVTTQQPTTLYGENNFANLPAVVVEVGFKDNVNDATAMADTVFQGLMAKGIEKGARLSRESKVCKPFKLLSAANISGPNRTRPPVVVKFEGFPQYPIKVHAHVASCPTGTCNDADFTINSTTDNTFTWNFGCNSSASAASITYGVETTAVDADGVKVAAVKSNVTCQKVVASS
ncbi:N-acetylmuramoyl-L-alanine amidase [Xanthomonas arboricola]|uniref:N-acetylmuramoyl-L-alanine amidase n=1 Tax=Xanthomonas arboricola TaxID=56448 RepID=UPI00142F5234|nr:N-acetylmuramoyl-L-alanine amidase [Xanthomonas arboricola]NJB77388.1 hypothetical protein [Xanthomonas arboricola]